MQEAISFTPQLTASPIAEILWLIPALPVAAAAVTALLGRSRRKDFRHSGYWRAEFFAAALAGGLCRMW
jgi:hypothetical protein